MRIETLVRKMRISLRCKKEIHKWEYCTWGSALVNNLDGTHDIWSIPTRFCQTCRKEEYKLKNVFVPAKKHLTINDLK